MLSEIGQQGTVIYFYHLLKKHITTETENWSKVSRNTEERNILNARRHGQGLEMMVILCRFLEFGGGYGPA
jgi:hypothetical protein